MPAVVSHARGSDTPPYIGGYFLWIPATPGYCGPFIVHASGSNVNVAGTDVGGTYCNSKGNLCTEEVYEQIADIELKFSLTIP